MNRKILSALLIAVITGLMYINCMLNIPVTNENQETEKLTVAEEVKEETELVSGITKEINDLLSKSDNTLYSGITNDLQSTIFYSLSKATISVNETEMVAQAPEVITVKFTSDELNCRTSPDPNSEVITAFPIGQEIQTVGTEGEWVKVKLGEETYGYVHGNYLRDNNPLQYIGEYKLTYYTDSVECCGKAGQPTASGVYPVDGVTIATDPSIPFGTKLVINNHIYTVQDRGGAIKGNVIDVFKDLPHQALLELGVDYADVYIYTE